MGGGCIYTTACNWRSENNMLEEGSRLSQTMWVPGIDPRLSGLVVPVYVFESFAKGLMSEKV